MTGTHREAAIPVAVALLVSACGLSPLSHHIDVGAEPFVILVGEGIDHHTDLFAVPASGGSVFQVTFTPLVEAGPRLGPQGTIVAFLRMRDTLPATRRDVVLMDLQSGAESVLELPAGCGQARAVAWNGAGNTLYIRTERGLWQVPVPPTLVVAPVPAASVASADSALDLWLGRPRFARVVACPTGGICVVGPKGDTTPLAPAGAGAMRWGDDSVGWFEHGAIEVRSLGPGRLRRLNWTNPPEHPREASYAGGAPPIQP